VIQDAVRPGSWLAKEVAESADELVEGILIVVGIPELRHLAVTHAVYVCFFDFDAPAAPAGAEDHQYDAVLIVGKYRPDIQVERSLCDLHELTEHPVDCLASAVVAGQLAPPAEMPQDILGKQVVESGEVARAEGGISALDTIDVRMLGHELPSRLLTVEDRTH
jgi:hypothetical protein